MKTRLGQAVVEVMIAIGIAIVALLGLVQLTNRSVNNSGVARRGSDAEDLAGTAMELLRHEKTENGWTAFRAAYSSGAACFDGTTIVASASCPVTGTVYTSRITFAFSPVGALEQATVAIYIDWVDGSVDKSATLETVLTKH